MRRILLLPSVMVDYMCQLDWARNTQIAGKMFFLDVPVRKVLDDTSIRISRLGKRGHPHQCWWASSNQLRAWIEQKVRRGLNLLFAWAELRHLFSPALRHQSSWFLGLRLKLNCTSGFPGSPARRGSLLGLHDHVSKFLWWISKYIFPIVLFLWRTLTNMPPLHFYFCFLTRKLSTLGAEHIILIMWYYWH